MGKKSQVSIISAILILLISIGLVATTYIWSRPLTEKRQTQVVTERIIKAFDKNNVNSLPRKIEYVAGYGGKDTFTSDTEGIWSLFPYDYTNPESNSIQFSFSSKSINVQESQINAGWLLLTQTNPAAIGRLGVDDPSVVFERIDRTGDSFNITYKLWFRELERSPTEGVIIALVKDSASPLTSTGKTIKISRGDTKRQTVDGKTLIVTEVKIFLE